MSTDKSPKKPYMQYDRSTLKKFHPYSFENDDIDRIQRQLAQKSNEADLWKQKYENQLSQLMQVKANYELEVQQLSQEVQRLLSKLDDFEYEKQRYADDTRFSLESNQIKQIDIMKRSHYQHSELQEQQIRKLQELLDEKDCEIDELVDKLDRLRNEDDCEIQRILKDNESLRSRINMAEVERQKELEQLRSKIEVYNQSILDNMRKTHANQIEVLEGEIDKLRGLLEIKNAEIETLIQQNMKIKQSYDGQIQDYRMEVDCLKQKMLDNEHIHRNALEDYQSKIMEDHQDDINSIKNNYEKAIKTLEDEIRNLNHILKTKSNENQDLLSDKQNQKDYFEDQIKQMGLELEDEKQKCYYIEREKNVQIEQMEEDIQRLKAGTDEQRDQLVNQVQFLEGEISRLKELMNQKQKDLDQQNQQFIQHKRQYEEDLRNWRYDNEQLKQKIYESDRNRVNEIDELKQRSQNNDMMNREKYRNLEQKYEQLLGDYKRMKEQMDIKQSELENAQNQKGSYEKEVRRVKEENESLKQRLVQFDKDKIKEQEDLRYKLDQSNAYQIENLKTAFNTQLNILQNENQDLRSIIEQKSKDIQDLLDKYQILDRAMSQGIYGPEAAANRNIYDVYLRTKNRVPSVSKR